MDRGDILAGGSFRAVLRSTLVFVTVMSAGTFLAVAYLNKTLTEDARQRVLELHLGVQQMHEVDNNDADLISRVETLISGAAGAALAYAVYDANGDYLTGNMDVSLEPGAWQKGTIQKRGKPNPDDSYLLHASQIGDLIFVSGRNLDFIETAKVAIVRGVTLAGFMVVLAMIGIGYLMSSRSQAKFEHIENVLERVADGEVGARIGILDSHDQIDRISQKIDLQLAKLDGMIENTRRSSAAVAHDLRKPLARASLQLEQGLAKAEAGHDTRGEFEDALAALGNLNSIVSTILRITRIESHDIGRLESFDLRDTLDEIVSAYRAVAEDAGQTLNYAGEGQRLLAVGDADMIAQLVINLLQNAVTHAGAGAIITLDATQSGGQVMLVVSDNGPGIHDELRPRVFEPLFRADAARSTDGNGLGLALVKAIADRHGTEINLSDAEPGLKATLMLPAGRAH
ncbi:MAG: sensor histidine kinase [Octadecabacter sp.]